MGQYVQRQLHHRAFQLDRSRILHVHRACSTGPVAELMQAAPKKLFEISRARVIEKTLTLTRRARKPTGTIEAW